MMAAFEELWPQIAAQVLALPLLLSPVLIFWLSYRRSSVAFKLLVSALLPVLLMALALYAIIAPEFRPEWILLTGLEKGSAWPWLAIQLAAALYGLSLAGRRWWSTVIGLGIGIAATSVLIAWAWSLRDFRRVFDLDDLAFRIAVTTGLFGLLAAQLAARRLGGWFSRPLALFVSVAAAAAAAWTATPPSLPVGMAADPAGWPTAAILSPDGAIYTLEYRRHGSTFWGLVPMRHRPGARAPELVTRRVLGWPGASGNPRAGNAVVLRATARYPVGIPREQLIVLELSTGNAIPICDRDPAAGGPWWPMIWCHPMTVFLGPGQSFLWRGPDGDSGRLASGRRFARPLLRRSAVGTESAYPFYAGMVGTAFVSLERAPDHAGTSRSAPMLCSLDLESGAQAAQPFLGLPATWDVVGVSPFAPEFAFRSGTEERQSLLIGDGSGDLNAVWEGPISECPPILVWTRKGGAQVPDPTQLVSLVESTRSKSWLGRRIREGRGRRCDPVCGREVDGGFFVADGHYGVSGWSPEAWFFARDLSSARYFDGGAFQELDDSIVQVLRPEDGRVRIARRWFDGRPDDVLLDLPVPAGY